MDPKERAVELFKQAYQSQVSGDLDRAVELYTGSISLHPSAEAYTFLGWTYSFMGRLDDAIAECERAIATDPTFGNPYNDIGAYLLQLSRPNDAVQWLKKALDAPRYASYHFAHMNLGRAYSQLGEWDEARRSFKAALEIEPNYPPARWALTQLIARSN